MTGRASIPWAWAVAACGRARCVSHARHGHDLQFAMTEPIRSDRAKAASAPSFVHLKVHSAYSLLEGALHHRQARQARRRRTASRRSGSPTPTTCSARWSSPTSWPTPASSRSSAARCRSTSATARRPDGLQRAGADQPRVAAGRRARAARHERARLRQPDEARQPRLLRSRRRRAAARQDRARSQAHGDGLIALTGGPDGPIDRALREGQKDARARAPRRRSRRSSATGSTSRSSATACKHEIEAEPQLLELAYARALPIVATNEVYFATPDDYEAHDALLCIAEGRYVTEDDRRRLYARALLQDAPSEMAELFADLPEALANTIEIAKRCAFRPQGRKPILPRFVAAAPGASEDELLALEAAELRAPGRGRPRSSGSPRTPLAPGFTADDYEKRLAFEVDVISKMKFPGYFLIVADFIKWAKAQRHPRRARAAARARARSSPGRSPSPTSIRLRFGLLFERFLNPERVSMPDFDIDFCQDRRDEVIRYVQQQVRRRPRGADHHARQAAGARRAARRRPRAADALRAGRPAVQAGAQQSGQPGDAAAGDRGRAQAAGGSATASRWWRACSRSRRSSKASTATPPRTPPAW